MHGYSVGYSVFDLKLHDWRLYAGAHNISTQDPYEQSFHIRRVVLHPGYNVTSLENDIALVFTVEQLQYDTMIRFSIDSIYVTTIAKEDITTYMYGSCWRGCKHMCGHSCVWTQEYPEKIHMSYLTTTIQYSRSDDRTLASLVRSESANPCTDQKALYRDYLATLFYKINGLLLAEMNN